MGTKESNLEKYQNLWLIFENLYKKEGLNLSSFSKKWVTYNDESGDHHQFYDKLKRQSSRKDSLKEVKSKSLDQLEEYIKFLNKDFTAEKIRSDETYAYWFD
jgi:hypothetical protein